MQDIKVGLSKEKIMHVQEKDTARSYGSGLLDVFATPAMISFMENVSMELVQEYLPEGFGTVGTSVNISHHKASPLNSKIKCRSRLIEIENRRLLFELEVRDNEIVVGSGTHERFIIEEKRFLEKLK